MRTQRHGLLSTAYKLGTLVTMLLAVLPAWSDEVTSRSFTVHNLGSPAPDLTQAVSRSFTVWNIAEDCNQNGIRDTDDIAIGDSEDLNGNNKPDECETPFIMGNANGDTGVNSADAVFTVGYIIGQVEADCADAMDLTADGVVSVSDAFILLHWLFVPGSAPVGFPFGDCGLAPAGAEIGCSESYCP